MKHYLLSLLLVPGFALADVRFDIKNPTYEKGRLVTYDGGIVEGTHFRIQARHIEYLQNEERSILAEGDLMVEYQSRTFIGDKFYYNFIEQKGYLINGRTSDGLWFIGGEKIDFMPDRSVAIQNAFVTTSEDSNPLWEFHAKKLSLTKQKQLDAKSVTFRFSKVPVLYLPYFSSNVGKKTESPIKYNATWESGQGPKLSMRYKVYETDTFSLFTRLDYRIRRGGGGALETDYRSLDRKVKFQTKSYLAHDTFVKDLRPNVFKTRWRLQGIYNAKKLGDKMDIFMRYDYISDKYMPGDFPTDDFALSTAKRTELVVNRMDKWVTSNVYIRPRINTFQGFKQEIPNVKIGIKPFEIPNSGLILTNQMKIAYLDYDYSEKMQIPVGATPLATFRSGRFQTSNAIYRPINLHFLTLTPRLGYSGIYYTNTQNNTYTALSKYTMQLAARSDLYRTFPSFTQVITPYVNYRFIKVSNQLRNHYIFSIDDGIDDINYILAGVKTFFYPLGKRIKPVAFFDFYAFGFFDANTVRFLFPNYYLNMGLQGSRMEISTRLKFNPHIGSLLQANTTWKWTISNALALSAELRHRNNLQIRKSNYRNFYVDVTTTIQERNVSPLSDRRNTLLLKAQANLTPFTYCRLQSHIGWGRKTQKAYTESKVDFYTMLTTNWRLRLSYQHTTYDDQVTFGVSLIPYRKD